jgi:hypothetical protein
MTGDARSFCLYSLGASYLQTFRSGIAVERHILSFERSRIVAILLEDTTESGSKNALAYVTACTSQHYGM